MTNEDKQKNVEQFLQVPKNILKAKYYLSLSTGKAVDIDLTSKSVYSWMKDRFTFFTKDNGQYYDSQSDVADALGLHRNTVGKIIAKFLEHGIFVVEKRKNGRFENNVYVQIHSLTLVDAPKASQKAPKSVSPITLHPCQGLEEIVESKAPLELYSESVAVIEENDWEGESEVVFIEHAPVPIPAPASVRDPSKVYAGDYFSDYPAKFYKITGQHSDEFLAWLDGKGGVIVDNFHFTLGGIEYFIPYDPAWKLQDAI
ncbi:helix-turn-helix domain-containing protein [uncultured Pseudomonas sp.]|uniref:DUF6945 domain-containing protein n=1 Tax=uncultured Pseudomonas sp. TaxID=114707 RepID=UPI0025E434E9|nr:helix-turn-helix domain-containing protein [uncultured Pseudomonas sp.]